MKSTNKAKFVDLVTTIEEVLLYTNNSKLKVTAKDKAYIDDILAAFDTYGHINVEVEISKLQPIIFRLWAMSKRITAEHIPQNYHLIEEKLKDLGFELRGK
jgi:transcription initiation factor IIE alpha subunit